MEEVIQSILNNPVYLGIAIGLLALIVFSLIKKLLKVAWIGVVLLIVYLVYLAVTGEEPPAAIEDTLEKAGDTVEEVIDAAKDTDLDEIKEKAESLLD